MTHRRDSVCGLLICLLTLAAADPLWTLWRVPDDGNALKEKTALERENCEAFRRTLEAITNTYIEIDHDVVTRRERPVGKRTYYRCLPGNEAPQ